MGDVARARRTLTVFSAVLSILLWNVPVAQAAASDAGYNNARILEFMNAERAARGVRSVSRDPALDQKAQAWAEKLAAEARMYHSSSYAGMSVGYRSAAQNLAYQDNSLSAAQAHNMWMASGVHRKNILDPDFSNVGIAIVCSVASGKPYVMAVVEFGGDGSPSNSTPDRNPQVAGGSGNARAMSCDDSSGGGDPVPVPAAPSTTSTTTTTSRNTPQTSPRVIATTSTTMVKPTTTSRRPATSTNLKTGAAAASSGSTTRAAGPAVVAAASSVTSTTTTTGVPGPIEPNLAASEGEEAPSSAGWLLTFLAAGAGLVWMSRLQGRGRHSPKHSIGRKGP